MGEFKAGTLVGLAGQSPRAFVSFWIKTLIDPVNAPLLVVYDNNLKRLGAPTNDAFRIELILPIDVSVFNPLLNRFVGFSPGSPLLRTFVAAVIGGAYYYSNYYTVLPRFQYGVGQLFQIFYNYKDDPRGINNVLVLHDVSGQPRTILDPQISQETTYIGPFGGNKLGGPTFPIPVNWGNPLTDPSQVGLQPAYHVGYDPQLPGYAFDGSLGGLAFSSNPQITPSLTIPQMIEPATGGFINPKRYLFPSYTPPIAMIGGPGYGGISGNYGIVDIGGGYTVDTGLHVPAGMSLPTAGDYLFIDEE